MTGNDPLPSWSLVRKTGRHDLAGVCGLQPQVTMNETEYRIYKVT